MKCPTCKAKEERCESCGAPLNNNGWGNAKGVQFQEPCHCSSKAGGHYHAWKPIGMEKFYYISTPTLEVCCIAGDYNEGQFEIGNCFQTESQAQRAANAIKKTLAQFWEEESGSNDSCGNK